MHMARSVEPKLPTIEGQITREKVTEVLSAYLNEKLPLYHFPARIPHLDWISPTNTYRVCVDGRLKDSRLWQKELAIVGWHFQIRSDGSVIDRGFAYSR